MSADERIAIMPPPPPVCCGCESGSESEPNVKNNFVFSFFCFFFITSCPSSQSTTYCPYATQSRSNRNPASSAIIAPAFCTITGEVEQISVMPPSPRVLSNAATFITDSINTGSVLLKSYRDPGPLNFFVFTIFEEVPFLSLIRNNTVVPSSSNEGS